MSADKQADLPNLERDRPSTFFARWCDSRYGRIGQFAPGRPRHHQDRAGRNICKVEGTKSFSRGDFYAAARATSPGLCSRRKTLRHGGEPIHPRRSAIYGGRFWSHRPNRLYGLSDRLSICHPRVGRRGSLKHRTRTIRISHRRSDGLRPPGSCQQRGRCSRDRLRRHWRIPSRARLSSRPRREHPKGNGISQTQPPLEPGTSRYGRGEVLTRPVCERNPCRLQRTPTPSQLCESSISTAEISTAG